MRRIFGMRNKLCHEEMKWRRGGREEKRGGGS
jgi:hypothetical protein